MFFAAMAPISSLKRAVLLLPFILGLVSGEIPQYTQEDIESGKALADLSKIAYSNAMSRLENPVSPDCTKENVKVFKEWY